MREGVRARGVPPAPQGPLAGRGARARRALVRELPDDARSARAGGALRGAVGRARLLPDRLARLRERLGLCHRQGVAPEAGVGGPGLHAHPGRHGQDRPGGPRGRRLGRRLGAAEARVHLVEPAHLRPRDPAGAARGNQHRCDPSASARQGLHGVQGYLLPGEEQRHDPHRRAGLGHAHGRAGRRDVRPVLGWRLRAGRADRG
ncbi:unnamed protein product, partial [Prorocentrum cordatum]